MDRALAYLEPLLDGEIRIRRDQPAVGPAATGPGAATEQVERPAGRRGGERPPLRVDEFERVEDYLRAYIEDEWFRAAHPLASGRWVVAWEMLWCADSKAKVIAVAGRASDAMQAFAASLLERCTPLPMDPQWPTLVTSGSAQGDPLEALVAVLGAYRIALGEPRGELLDALLDHWRALVESMRGHEQRPQAGGERLRWEDGRRLVLFTALVMVEIDRSFA